MSKKEENVRSAVGGVRIYSAPWKGELVLVCSKCQRKLKGGDDGESLTNLKKTLKKMARAEGKGTRLRVVSVSCLKLCPKGGVAVTTESLLCRLPSKVALLRTKKDARSLLRDLVSARDDGHADESSKLTDAADRVVSEAGIEPATVSLEG